MKPHTFRWHVVYDEHGYPRHLCGTEKSAREWTESRAGWTSKQAVTSARQLTIRDLKKLTPGQRYHAVRYDLVSLGEPGIVHTINKENLAKWWGTLPDNGYYSKLGGWIYTSYHRPVCQGWTSFFALKRELIAITLKAL
jgi:hypothetical protein